jgi:chemotaxis signal transduction protein
MVNEVNDIPDSQIEPPLKAGRSDGNYIPGIGEIESEKKIFLDINKLLYLSEVANKDDEK